MAYEPVINPIAGVSEWEIRHRPMTPPLFRRQPGRPKLSRNKAPSEAEPPPNTTKLSKSYYSRVSRVNCGLCGNKGHNRRTCGKRNQTHGTNVDMEVPNQHVESSEVEHLPPQQSEASYGNQGINVDVINQVNAMNNDIPMVEANVAVDVLIQSQESSSSKSVLSGRFKRPAMRTKPSQGTKQPIWKY